MNRRLFGKFLGLSPLTAAALLKAEEKEAPKIRDYELTAVVSLQHIEITAMPSTQWVKKDG